MEHFEEVKAEIFVKMLASCVLQLCILPRIDVENRIQMTFKNLFLIEDIPCKAALF